MNKIKQILFGVRAQGEPIGDPCTHMVIPNGGPRPSFNEWCIEYGVSRLYTQYGTMKVRFGARSNDVNFSSLNN